MTRLRLGLSHRHRRDHKFNHNFQNCIDLLFSCGMDIKSTSHFFLHFPLVDDKRITLLSTLNKIDCKLIETNESSLIETLLFGNSLFDLKKNSLILNASIDYVVSTKRFEEAFLQQVLITTTKYSCRSNHLFILSKFFNLLYSYLDLVTFTIFFILRRCQNFLVPGDCKFQFTCWYIILFIEKKLNIFHTLFQCFYY